MRVILSKVLPVWVTIVTAQQEPHSTEIHNTIKLSTSLNYIIPHSTTFDISPHSIPHHIGTTSITQRNINIEYCLRQVEILGPQCSWFIDTLFKIRHSFWRIIHRVLRFWENLWIYNNIWKVRYNEACTSLRYIVRYILLYDLHDHQQSVTWDILMNKGLDKATFSN